MLNCYTVAFFGHRQIADSVGLEERLEQRIRQLLASYEYVEFLVGRNGDFDQWASCAVRRAQRSYGEDNSALVLVLPYLTAEYCKNEQAFHAYYTEVEVSRAAAKAHPKSAISVRNREMVDRADAIFCWIERNCGGAWEAVSYACKQGKTVVNFAVPRAT